jgi:ribulose-5-phosphate 4-epimerase/fuculose-1-phosphate aldolase
VIRARTKDPVVRPRASYIKFDCRLTPAKPPARAAVAELVAVRRELRRLGLVGAYPDGMGFGNLSRRTGSGRAFVVSGTATGGLRRILPRHFVVVDRYSLAGNRVNCRGAVRSSAESLTHAAVYEADARIRAVLHIHSLALWTRGRAGGLPATPPDAGYGTPEMAKAIRRVVRAGVRRTGLLRGAVVMAGHREGLIVYGRDLGQAMSVVERLVAGVGPAGPHSARARRR